MVYEFQCANAECPDYGKTKDSYLPRFESPNPSCPKCQFVMQRVFLTPPRLGWAKSYGSYGDPTREYYNPEGHWAYRVNTTRNPDGSPEKVWIDSVQKAREFAKAEGLRMPDEINPNAEMSKDGRSLKTCGVKGQWLDTPASMLQGDSGEKHLEGWV